MTVLAHALQYFVDFYQFIFESRAGIIKFIFKFTSNEK